MPPTSKSTASSSLVAVTRAVPGEVDIPGAEVRIAPAEPQMTRGQLLEFVRGSAVVVSMFHDRIDAEFLDSAGPQLRGVCNFAVGVDNFDLAECRRRSIAVTNTPDAVTEGTANIAFALMLAAARRVGEGDRFVRAGKFERQGNIFPTGWLGVHTTGQTLLIIGAGRIGRAVALRALGFGMRVMYVARTAHPDFEQAPIAAERIELDEGLRRADFVSIHTPLTPETRHLIDARRLGLMKPTAVLVNTARGPVVDEKALASALRAGVIFGAGLDVFEFEPRVLPELLECDNAVFTPHIGSGERKYRELMTAMVYANARAILAGERPPNLVA
ncbi:MAG: D-glycerate dehydrogenase [Phycisphaeraceae bacterium]|nr:D-glycerate dehydrogenase [Phycisphaeraceae bacterium]